MPDICHTCEDEIVECRACPPSTICYGWTHATGHFCPSSIAAAKRVFGLANPDHY